MRFPEREITLKDGRTCVLKPTGPEVAAEMVGHGKFLLNVDYCISFTGNAGPDAMENKPVGEVYIGVCTQDLAQVQKFMLSGTRDEIQNQAVSLGIEMLKNMILEKN